MSAIRKFVRWSYFGVLALVLVGAAWAATSARLSPSVLAQQGPNRAALAVRLRNGRVQTACVSFDTPVISGSELLTRSGLQAVMDFNSGLGGAVCSVNGDGCAYPKQECFCQCQGLRCEYWASYHWIDGAWQYSQVGASSYQVTDGALEGWTWGQGDFSSGEPPPQVTYADVCAQPALAAGAQGPAVDSDSSAQPRSHLPRSAALPSSYIMYLLVAVLLIGAYAWVLARRKGQPAWRKVENQGGR